VRPSVYTFPREPTNPPCHMSPTTNLMCSSRAHGGEQFHYPNAMNHAGHAHTYSGPPPSLLAAQMAAGHAPPGGDHEYRGRGVAYQGGTLGRPHHHHHQVPPPPAETMNGGSMPLPPMEYGYVSVEITLNIKYDDVTKEISFKYVQCIVTSSNG